MRALSLVVVLLAAAAQAQVAGLCGAGKACTVRSVRATGAGPAGGSGQCGFVVDNGYICDSTTSVRIAMGSALSGAWGVYSGGTRYLLVSPSTTNTATLNRFVAQGLNTSGTETAGGLAFASFPTCSATYVGELRYDSTNNVWRFCDGATWLILATTAGAADEGWTAYEPSTLATGVNFIGAFKPARTHTTARMRCVGRTAGSGSGNVTVSIYDQTGAATRCTLTVACASSGGTLASTACAITAGNDHVLSVNAAGCSAAPFANAVCNVTFE